MNGVATNTLSKEHAQLLPMRLLPLPPRMALKVPKHLAMQSGCASLPRHPHCLKWPCLRESRVPGCCRHPCPRHDVVGVEAQAAQSLAALVAWDVALATADVLVVESLAASVNRKSSDVKNWKHWHWVGSPLPQPQLMMLLLLLLPLFLLLLLLMQTVDVAVAVVEVAVEAAPSADRA